MLLLNRKMMGSEFTPTEQILKHSFEKKENPQAYDQTPFAYVSPKPARHILGLVGGNEVSLTMGNRVDLESDLHGTTRPNTWCAFREHQPPHVKDTTIKRDNPKNTISINTTAQHLPVYQMWAYPASLAPLPLQPTVCVRPEKY